MTQTHSMIAKLTLRDLTFCNSVLAISDKQCAKFNGELYLYFVHFSDMACVVINNTSKQLKGPAMDLASVGNTVQWLCHWPGGYDVAVTFNHMNITGNT